MRDKNEANAFNVVEMCSWNHRHHNYCLVECPAPRMASAFFAEAKVNQGFVVVVVCSVSLMENY